jgi:hypothetical protein
VKINQYYDVYGVGIEVTSSQGSIVDALKEQIGFFERARCESILSLDIGPLPESVSLSGSSIGDNLFYNAKEDKTIVLRKAKPSFTEKDVLYVVIGDIRNNYKTVVYVPNVKRRHYPNWIISMHHLLTRNFVNIPSKLITDYLEGGKIISRILEPSLYYSLPNRGLSFLHGSAVFKDLGLLFFGPSNVGKSTIALEMVKRGWEFLGDDLVIVDQNRRLLPYPKPVKLEGQTIAAHPYLFEGLSPNMGRIDKLALRRFMKKAVEKPFRTALDASINELFKDAKICPSCPIDRIVRLTRTTDDKPAIREIDLDSGIRSLSVGLFWEFNMQWWRYNQYLYSSSLFSNKDFVLEEAMHHEKIADIISKSLSGSRAFEFQVPNDHSKVDRAVDLLLTKL